MNISEFLLISSAIVPDRNAIIFENERITFEHLQNEVNNLAKNLIDIGVTPDNRVAVMDVNCSQLAQIFFATMQIDAIYVPVNFRARAEELKQMLNASTPQILFIGSRYLKLLNDIDLGSDLRIIVTDSSEFKDLLSGEGEQTIFP